MAQIETGRKRQEFGTLLGETAEEEQQRSPRSKLDNSEALQMHRELMGHFEQELSVQGSNRIKRAKAEEIYDGQQWTADEEQQLEERGQTPTVVNVVAPAINWMLGTERRNRSQARVLPRRKEGRTASEQKTKLLKYIADVCHSEMEKSWAFADAVKTGLGWLEAGAQDDVAGEVVFERHVPWRQCVHDSMAARPDMQDARYFFRAKWTDVNLATATFPERAETIRLASRDESLRPHGGTDGYGDNVMDEREEETSDTDGFVSNIFAAFRPRVRLIECWSRRPEMAQVLVGGEFAGEIYDSNSRGHVNSILMGQASVKSKRINRVYVTIMTSAGLISHEPSPYRHNKFPFTPIWGNRYAGSGLPYGLIEAMRFLQDDINKRASKATWILNSNQIQMEDGAVEDPDEYALEAARPDGVMIHKQGYAIPNIHHGKELAAAQFSVMSQSIDLVQSLSGVTDESLGRETNASSGKAILARQQQGAMTTAHYFDNLRFALQLHGEKLLSVTEQFMSREKQFRIAGDKAKYTHEEINNPNDPATDITATKGDFVLSEEDWKATNRQASADTLMELMKQIGPVAPEVAMACLDLFIDMLDLPNAEEVSRRVRNITGIADPDEDPENPSEETIAREQAKADQQEELKQQNAMLQRKAAADIAASEAKAEHEKARALGENVKTMQNVLDAKRSFVAALRESVEHSVDMLNNRMAVPAADALIAEAEADIAKLMIDIQQLTGAAPPPQPTTPPQAALPANPQGQPAL